jgi:hypothetical protein
MLPSPALAQPPPITPAGHSCLLQAMASDARSGPGLGGEVLRVNPLSQSTLTNNSSPTGNPVLDTPSDMALLPNLNIALADEGGGIAPQVVSINPATGARTLVSGPGRGVGPALGIAQALAVESSGNILVVDQDPAAPGSMAVIRIAPNGDRSVLSATGTGTGPSPARARSVKVIGGTIYLLTDSQLMTVDARTGSRTLISGSTRGTGPTFVFPVSISEDTTSNSLIVLDQQASGGSGLGLGALIRVDMTSGDRTVFSNNSTPPGGEQFDGPIDIAYNSCEHAFFVLQSGFNGGPIIPGKILRVDSGGARTLYAQFTGADNYSLLVLNPGFTQPPGGGPGGGGGGGL